MRYFIFACILLVLGACLNAKVGKENQYLLAPPVIKGNVILPAENFAYMHRQKPNTRFLFWSKAAIYQLGEKRFRPEKVKQRIDKVEEEWNTKIRTAFNENDSLRAQHYIDKQKKKLKKLNRAYQEGNWFMRVVGQKPVFFDSMATVLTANEMAKLLRTKGFFQGRTSFEINSPAPKYKRAIYTIHENLPTRIHVDSNTYVSNSITIDTLLKKHEGEKLLKHGDYYSTANLDAERYRLEQLLRNNGFMFFSRQYINFEIDTTHFTTFTNFDHTLYTEAQQDSVRKQKRFAKVKVIIEKPAEGEHKAYNVDAVYMHQIIPRKKHLEPDTLFSRDSHIYYVYVGKTLRHEHNVLDKRIHLRPTEKFSSQKIIDTQNALNLLDMYKFVNVKTDTIGGKLHAHIFSNSLDRYQLTFEAGANVAQGAPGPVLNLSLKNRNVFGGAEIFETSLRLLIDGQTSITGQGVYSRREIGGSFSLTFPRILFPSSLMPRKLRTNIYAYNPTTKLVLGYNATRSPEFTRSTFAGSISYKGQLKRATYNLTLAEVSIINTTRLSDEFDQELKDLEEKGNLLKINFGQSLLGSTSFTYTYNSTTDIKLRNSYYFRILLEMGGNSLRIIDNLFTKYNNDRVLNLPYFEFYRINPSFHYYIPRPNKRFWAFRVNAGVAVPFGHSSVLPYEKFFYVGGGSSLRAWPARRLGQGGRSLEFDEKDRPKYKPKDTIEKLGEIVLEANAEYRFPLYQGWIEGATFIDVGNVWTLNENDSNKGSSIGLNKVFEQIAIGTGFGVRMDFSFILLRFDVGLKVYEPGREAGSRWVAFQNTPLHYFQQRMFAFQIGIGYPF